MSRLPSVFAPTEGGNLPSVFTSNETLPSAFQPTPPPDRPERGIIESASTSFGAGALDVASGLGRFYQSVVAAEAKPLVALAGAGRAAANALSGVVFGSGTIGQAVQLEVDRATGHMMDRAREFSDNSEPTPQQQVQFGVADALATGARAKAQELRATLPTKAEEFGSREWFASVIGGSGPQALASIGATAVGGPLAGVTVSTPIMAGQQAETLYHDRLAQGWDKWDAAAEALIPSFVVGLAQAGVEQAGVEKLIRTGVLHKGILAQIKKIPGAALAEGFEEVVQGDVGRVARKLQTGRGPEFLSPEANEQRVQEFVGGAAGGVVFAGGAVAAGLTSGKKTAGGKKLSDAYVGQKYISDIEATVIGERTDVLKELVTRRLNGEQVDVESENGDPYLVSQGKDPVPLEVQEALGHNPVSIQFMRDEIAAGRASIYTNPSRLPPTMEEVSASSSRLTKLRDKLITELKPMELTEDGAPATERALVTRYLTNQIGKLSQDPSRLHLQQAEALENLVSKVRNSEVPIDETVSKASMENGDIIGLDMKPVSQFRLPLTQSEKKGYFNDPAKITQDTKLQTRIATAQHGMMEQVSVLVNSTKLEPGAKAVMFGVLDAEHQGKIEKILGKDSTGSEVKAKVRSRIAQAKAPNPQKLEMLNTLDHAMEMIAKDLDGESVQGVVDRLGTQLKDAPAEVKSLVEGLRSKTTNWTSLVEKYAYDEFLRRSTKGEEGTAEQDYSRAEQRLKRQLVDIEQGPIREKIIKSLSGLSTDQAKPFIDSLRGVKSSEALATLATEIETTRAGIQRAGEVEYLKRTSTKIEKNPRRDVVEKLLAALTPEKKAQGREVVKNAVVELKDKTTAEGDNHYEATRNYIAKQLKVTPQTADGLIAKDDPRVTELLKDSNPDLFRTSRGRLVDRVEAARITEAAKNPVSSPSAGATKPPTASGAKPGSEGAPKKVVAVEPTTGKRVVDVKTLEKKLDKLTNDQITDLTNRVKQQVREGRIEAGLENKYLQYSLKENVRQSVQELESKSKRGEFAQKNDDKLHLAGIFADPVSTRGFLKQYVPKSLYRILHENLVTGKSIDSQNRADARRNLNVVAKVLGKGFGFESVGDQERLIKYFMTPVVGKATRGEALNAWLVSQDPGRQDIRELGVVKNGEKFELDRLIATLTPKDLEFGRSLREYFVNNPAVEKAFSVFRTLNGYDPPRTDNHWMSSRKPYETGPIKDFTTYTPEIISKIDPLRERLENVNTPYELKDVVSEYLRGSDSLSMFGEMGLELHQASTTLYSPEVEAAIKTHLGAANYDRLKLMLSDTLSSIGFQTTAVDRVLGGAISNFTVSRISGNPFSAAKQTMALGTLYADGTISARSLTEATTKGAAFLRQAGEELQAASGLAYERYHGHFLEHLASMSASNTPMSKVGVIQHHSLILQRTVDFATFKIAWVAAKLDVEKAGFTGAQARQETLRLFELAINRSQATNNPLYASELEVLAKRGVGYRGLVAFMRDLNRNYNVVRERVVEAKQNPTTENLTRAGKALMWGVFVMAAGNVGVNALRRTVFNKPTSDTDVSIDVLESITGNWYLSSTPVVIAESLMKQNPSSERLSRSPLVSMGKDMYDLVNHLANFTQAGEDTVKSGLHRGESKQSQELLRALDSAFSLAGGVTGLPLWAVWYQGRGLYNWNNPQYKLMTEFEQEKRQLKADGREQSMRYQELESAQKKISAIHRQREAGLASEAGAQKEIVRELEKVVR